MKNDPHQPKWFHVLTQVLAGLIIAEWVILLICIPFNWHVGAISIVCLVTFFGSMLLCGITDFILFRLYMVKLDKLRQTSIKN